jgi:hypothetical protein
VDIMTLDEALDASPAKVAINTTARENIMAHKSSDGALAVFKQMPDTRKWAHAPMNHALALDVDTNAWQPAQQRPYLRRPTH